MRYRLCALLLLCLCLAPLAVHADAVVKIMPLGDSITRGGPDTDTSFASYRYYLDDSLRASGYGVDFVGSVSSGYTKFVFDQNHEGHGGYTTGMMVGTSSFSPLAAWLAASPTPEIVLLHVGTNDALYGVPVATRLANVRSIIGLLRQKNPKVRVLVAKIIPTGNATLNRNSGLVDYNAALPSLAAGISTATSPVTVVDLYTGYDGVADNQPDGVHPKATGEKKMAAAWQRALAPILAAPTPTAATARPTTLPGTTATTTVRPGRRRPRDARGRELQHRRRGRRLSRRHGREPGRRVPDRGRRRRVALRRRVRRRVRPRRRMAEVHGPGRDCRPVHGRVPGRVVGHECPRHRGPGQRQPGGHGRGPERPARTTPGPRRRPR